MRIRRVQDVLNSKVYIDKTGLISYTNSVLDTVDKFICNSRLRRFGKTLAAEMLVAYYCKECDSEKMFADLEISNDRSFKKYLNSYEVMAYIHVATGKKFIVIIDEWDVLIRDKANNTAVQEEYINFLRGMFKGSEPTRFISLAYLTGILPIKKLKTQSALNNFNEFTMLNAGCRTSYVGFTESEVLKLSTKYDINFEEMKHWYDGYLLANQHIYNPKAVINVLDYKNFQSYWSQTGSYEVVIPLINMDFDGLKTAIIEMLSGGFVEVDVTTFQNDTINFSNRNDVITYLIHLGYLAYDQQKRSAFIPNEEIR